MTSPASDLLTDLSSLGIALQLEGDLIAERFARMMGLEWSKRPGEYFPSKTVRYEFKPKGN